jgi:RNA polymerase sigma-70 factor (ECF subfamily)
MKSEDRGAFAELYDRFFGLLYIHACRKLGDEEEAEDLLQELFANIWEKRQSIALTGSLSSYMFAAVRNRVLNIIERRRINLKYIHSLADYAVNNHRYADEKLREKELQQMIEKELDCLPEQMRVIFQMSRLEYLNYKEIGEKLDMSEQAVKSVMKRTLKILRRKLGLVVFFAACLHHL